MRSNSAHQRTLDQVLSGEPCCDQVEACCRCRLPVGHDGPHECNCGGSWEFDAEGQFRIIAFPQEYLG